MDYSDIKPGWRHISEIDPFESAGYVLDATPSAYEASALRQLRDGDRVLVSRSGRGFVWERSSADLPKYLATALINKR